MAAKKPSNKKLIKQLKLIKVATTSALKYLH